MGITNSTLVQLKSNSLGNYSATMMKIILALSLLVAVATAAMVGGVSDYKTDLNDPLVKFAMTEINNYYLGKGDNNARTAVSLISATKQVAGMLYTYTIQVTDGTNTERCAVTVWSRSWLSGADATQLSGEPQCQ